MTKTRAHGSAFERDADYLFREHDRLDVLLDSVRTHVYNGAWALARRDCQLFARDMDRHMRLEEQFLFPLFEERTSRKGPTTILREEHERIRAAMRAMGEAIACSDAGAFRKGLGELLFVLPAHNRMEAEVLYPATQRERPRPEAPAAVA